MPDQDGPRPPIPAAPPIAPPDEDFSYPTIGTEKVLDRGVRPDAEEAHEE
ncbi:hypothetical protein [Amycolatopsis jejuensis]|nr:hypothetical protein [Amycolatopsis jejuensis]